MFVEAGLTPMQALQSATINVARAFRKDKDFGTVEPGKIADIIVVDGDPLKDIWATQNVKTGRVRRQSRRSRFPCELPQPDTRDSSLARNAPGDRDLAACGYPRLRSRDDQSDRPTRF